MFKIIDVCLPDYFQGSSQPVLAIPVHHSLNRHDFINEVNNAYQSDELFYDVPELEQRLNEFVDTLTTHPFNDLCPSTTRGEGETVYAYVTYEWQRYTHTAHEIVAGGPDESIITIVSNEGEGTYLPTLDVISKVTAKMIAAYPGSFPNVFIIGEHEYHITFVNPSMNLMRTAYVKMGF